MDNMIDALMKANLISKSDVEEKERKEREQKEIERKQKEEAEKKRNLENEAQRKEQIERLQPIENLYNTMRPLLLHLVYAFSPSRIASRWFGSGTSVCPICNTTILTLDEALNPEKMNKFCELSLDAISQSLTNKNTQETVQKMREIYGNKRLGVCSPDSTKVLCEPCFSNLIEWTTIKIMNGDQGINRIIHKKMSKFVE
jgi:hypothetical protein